MANLPTHDAPDPANPPAHAPTRPDWTIDQHWERYSADEHAVWRHPHERQSRGVDGLRKLNAKKMKTIEFRTTRDQRP